MVLGESIEVTCASAFSFLAGASWAVQRPQGFLVALLVREGISESEVGLISACGLAAPFLGAPLLGCLADRLPPPCRHRVLIAGVTLRAACLLVAWPALGLAPGPGAFWGCLVAVVLASFWNVDGVLTELNIRLVGPEGFGRVRLWGGVGYGFGSLLTGLLADYSGLGLRVVFLEAVALGIMSACAALCLGRLASGGAGSDDVSSPASEFVDLRGESEADMDSLRVSPASGREFHSVGSSQCVGGPEGGASQGSTSSSSRFRLLFRFFASGHFPLFLVSVLALGLSEGVTQSYTYLRLDSLPNSSASIMGLCAVCAIASEVPFFHYAGQYLMDMGVMPVLGLSLLCAAARQGWTSVLWDARWVLPGECLHGVTFSIANAAIVRHVGDVAPVELRATAQSFVSGALFSGVGMGCAAWLGGIIAERWNGTVPLFRGSAILTFLAAIVPMLLAFSQRRHGTRSLPSCSSRQELSASRESFMGNGSANSFQNGFPNGA